MLENSKITSVQLACMIFLTLLATSMLTSAANTYSQAKQDMWITPLIGCLSGFIIVAIVVHLHRIYPGKTLIEYSEQILGTLLGKAISLLFLLISLQLNANQARQFSEFMTTSFYKQTPTLMLILTLMGLSAIAVRCGVEIIGRSALLLTPVIVVIVLALLLPMISAVEADRVLPLLSDGMVPILRGAAFLQVWFPQYVYMSFYLPFVSDVHKSRRWGFISVLWIICILTGSLLLVATALGPATRLFPYPFMIITRYVSILRFFEHLDALIMLLWVLDVFVRSIVTYYACVIGFAQWFGVKDYKPLVIPIGLLITVLSFWSIPNFTQLNTNGTSIAFYYFFGNFVIPMLLFVIAKLRGLKPASSAPSVK